MQLDTATGTGRRAPLYLLGARMLALEEGPLRRRAHPTSTCDHGDSSSEDVAAEVEGVERVVDCVAKWVVGAVGAEWAVVAVEAMEEPQAVSASASHAKGNGPVADLYPKP